MNYLPAGKLRDGKHGETKLNNGDLGHKIAKELWPDLVFASEAEDKKGTDAHINGVSIQIKYDGTIAKTGNLYIEYYEKSEGRIDQPWRHSPMSAEKYIFVTTDIAYMVTVDALAAATIGKHITKIKPTSIGALIPLRDVVIEETRTQANDTPW